jgi:hypothetical protein
MYAAESERIRDVKVFNRECDRGRLAHEYTQIFRLEYQSSSPLVSIKGYSLFVSMSGFLSCISMFFV